MHVAKVVLLMIFLFFTDQNLYPSFNYNTFASTPKTSSSFKIYNLYADTAFVFPEILKPSFSTSEASAPAENTKNMLFPNRQSIPVLTDDTSRSGVQEKLLYITMFPFHADDSLRKIFSSAGPLLVATEKPHSSTDTANYHGFKIMGEGKLTEQQLHSFFLSNGDSLGISRLSDLILLYIDECRAEGVNHDVAFIQMCHETGFLRYDGTVSAEQNNFCGLGTVDEDTPGESFETAREGIRAHIQHLKAYASTKSLSRELVDRRFHYVQRGAAPAVKDLTGKWAADPLYDKKIIGLIIRAENHTGQKLI